MDRHTVFAAPKQHTRVSTRPQNAPAREYAALVSMADAVYCVDPAGRVTFVNPAFEAMTGYALADLRGTPSTHLYVPEATALTYQLLTFAKGGAPVRKTVSMVELLYESVGFALHGANVRADFHVAQDLWPVDIDAGQINQVLHNVVLNAVHAMPAGGTIRVRAENGVLGAGDGLPLPAGRYITVTVQDTGVGIPRALLPNVFDPYVTTKEQGSGLGLATAYAIMRKHDGHMTVESQEGVGTMVRIYQPASSQALAPPPAPATPPRVCSGRILVMDDEAMICELLHALLSSLGHEVVCVRDGAEALAVYQQAQATSQRFAAVILDHTIPGGMGGVDTMTRLRAMDPHVKALISSGYAHGPVLACWAAYGFHGVIPKPYTLERLQEALARLLQDREATASG